MAGYKALSREFAADMKAAVSTGPRKSATLLLYTIVLFFVGAVVWADWATVDEVTIGEGTVIPTRQVQVVQNLEGGILAEILVAEGDLVEAGQVLLRIDGVPHDDIERSIELIGKEVIPAVSRPMATAV